MPIFELTHESLSAVPRTTLHEQTFREREDLQRLLKTSISAIGDDLLVIAEEFAQWEGSQRRIDLLAIDRTAALVIIELKRNDTGSHMEFQALRYAAMISTLTFQQAVEAHAKFLRMETEEAEAALLDFLGASDPPDDFGKTVRIVLVSPDFSKELTTSVLWLNSSGLDIRCVRIRPYVLDGRTLLEVDQIIPLREAREYTVRVKEKEEEARQAAASGADFTRYDLSINGQLFPHLWKRGLVRQVIAAAAAAGLTVKQLTSIFPARRFFIVDGHLRGDEFLAAAEAERVNSGYVFRPKRFFTNDDKLIDIDGKTVAVSTQWGYDNLPMLDELIKLVPSAKISYTESAEQ